MKYMVIEHFRDNDARPVYARFRLQGRLAPTGLKYVASWVTLDLTTCYQVMEGERVDLDVWMRNWDDLVEFEVVEVMESQKASEAVSNG
ncbi:hypothetical protein LTR84_011309 [Exophiala bonariae]|uniref:Uncharacterized protein n=1 Tax=Exophiala bonariae TaxID=1690606 RepID=A0AAV9MVQ6_9EURO|nr:hypothetical protein LTR84_011309 [Exophiala bonariae]